VLRHPCGPEFSATLTQREKLPEDVTIAELPAVGNGTKSQRIRDYMSRRSPRHMISTIYLIVSLWIPGYDAVPLEMSRQADLAECLNGVAKAITNHDDIAMPDGTKFKYRISNTPADPA
jgi:hypothetical protein